MDNHELIISDCIYIPLTPQDLSHGFYLNPKLGSPQEMDLKLPLLLDFPLGSRSHRHNHNHGMLGIIISNINININFLRNLYLVYHITL
jgi:hypothetical protein